MADALRRLIAAGIPLTHRGVSRAFTVISGHALPSAEEFAGLAALGGSIVILMGVANLTGIATGLRAAGLPDATPAAAQTTRTAEPALAAAPAPKAPEVANGAPREVAPVPMPA